MSLFTLNSDLFARTPSLLYLQTQKMVDSQNPLPFFDTDAYTGILIKNHNYHLDKYLYVGDTNKDYIETKKANGVFIHAKYGFGTISDKVLAISLFWSYDKLRQQINQDHIHRGGVLNGRKISFNKRMG